MSENLATEPYLFGSDRRAQLILLRAPYRGGRVAPLSLVPDKRGRDGRSAWQKKIYFVFVATTGTLFSGDRSLRAVLCSCLCGGQAADCLAGAGAAEVRIVGGVIICIGTVTVNAAPVAGAGLYLAAGCLYPSGALQIIGGRAAGTAVHLPVGYYYGRRTG